MARQFSRISRRSTSGFTLIELLVAITIIAVLIAVLLPTINVSHGDSRRNFCSVNQKNLGLAITQYTAARKRLPGYRDQLMTNSGPMPVSWTTMILPNLEQRAVFDQIKLGNIDPSQPKLLPYLELMACPADPQDQTRPSTSYVANCGLPDKNPRDAKQIPLNWTGDPPAFAFNVPADWPANGAFVSHWEFGVDPKLLPQVTFTDFVDGLSNTFLLTESIDASVWNDTLSLPTSRKNPNANGYVKLGPGSWNTPEILSGFIWTGEKELRDNSGAIVAVVINGPTSKTSEATEMSQCRPSSMHAGGVNMAFADGHVAFVNENIDYLVYSLLMTPDGQHATPNGEPFIETPDLPPGRQHYELRRTKTATANDLQ